MESQPSNTTRNDSSSWIGGVILITLGVIFMLNQFVPWVNAFIWAAAFGAAGTGISMVYFRDRSKWWALIPAYVMWFVGAVILLGSLPIMGELIGTFIMFAIGFPFLYVYINDRRNWWALIPAYAMGAIGVLILLTTVLGGELIAAYVMFAIAVPFGYVYLKNNKNWWALIPGGIMALIGTGLLIGALAPIIPVVMILIGGYLLFRQAANQRQGTAPRTMSAPASRPISGPEADKPVEEFVKIQE